MKLNDKKPLLIILGSAFTLMLLIIIPLILTGERNESQKKKEFPNYKEVKIKESTFTDTEKYEELKLNLNNDYLFGRILFMDDYDSNNVTRKDLQNLIENFAVGFEPSNTKYLAVVNKEKKYACITEKNLVLGFEELYNMDITPYLDTLSYYFKYFFKKRNYCVYYQPAIATGIYARGYYVNKLVYDKESESITADLYLYSYIPDGELSTDNQIELKKAFENKNFNITKLLIKTEDNGEFRRKTIKFKINNNGKFFKYQIISIKTTDK